MTENEIRNIANWIFHAGCLTTQNGTCSIEISDINHRYKTNIGPEEIDRIFDTIQTLYPNATENYITYVTGWDKNGEPYVIIEFQINPKYYETKQKSKISA